MTSEIQRGPAEENFDQTPAFMMGVARELYRHCRQYRKGVEMPVGKRIREYMLQCLTPQPYADIRVFRTPLKHPGELPLRAGLAVFEKEGKKTAEIRFSPELNRCWTRFVVCKEYMHLLVDRELARKAPPVLNLTRTPLALDQLRSLLAKLDDPSRAVQVELLAMIGALEYLLPYEDRPRELAGDEEQAVQEIATRFRIPRYWVTLFYSGPGYKQASDSYHAMLNSMGTSQD